MAKARNLKCLQVMQADEDGRLCHRRRRPLPPARGPKRKPARACARAGFLISGIKQASSPW